MGPAHYLPKLDELLLDLYACPAQPQRWGDTLDQLCVATGACSVVVQAFTFEGDRARIHWVVQDTRTQAQRAVPVAGVADGDNPRLEPRRALRGLDRVAGDEVLFEPGDQARPVLEQRLATLGLGQFMGTLQHVGRGVYLGIALHRAVNDAGHFSREQLNRLTELAPHVGQAFVLADRLHASAARDRRLREHLDRLRCGVVLCDPAGQVGWANRWAQMMLDAGGALRLLAGRLDAFFPADTSRLLHEMALAAQAGSGAVRYARLGRGGADWHVAIQAGQSPGELVLVITDAAAPAEIPAEALTRLFGLTPTEARLLGALATGSTVEQYAQLRGVSIGTARGQLKQIQAKTGVSRQSDLVRLVLTSAVAHLDLGH